MRNRNMENENTMTGNDPVWETFVLLARAYGVDEAHSLTTESHGVDSANQYRDRFVDTYGHKCLACGAIHYADDEWQPQICGDCGSTALYNRNG